MCRSPTCVETHIHNDYVTGGLALSRAVGARYLLNAADPVPLRAGPAGRRRRVRRRHDLRVRVLATPGHTFTHLSYVLESGGEVAAVFTGGSLLYGSTGRPDLLGPDHTAALAQAQYASAHRLARELPDAAAILPTHGFGSFCAATQAQADSSTIGREKTAQPGTAARRSGRTSVRLLAGLDAWPGLLRAHGTGQHRRTRPDPTWPRRGWPTPTNCTAASRHGEWIVDLRDRTAFAAGFLPGSLQLHPGPQLRQLPGLDHPVGHADHPARRHPRPGGAGATGTGAHRHRPARRLGHRPAPGLDRRPAARPPAAGHLR